MSIQEGTHRLLAYLIPCYIHVCMSLILISTVGPENNTLQTRATVYPIIIFNFPVPCPHSYLLVHFIARLLSERPLIHAFPEAHPGSTISLSHCPLQATLPRCVIDIHSRHPVVS